MCIECHRTPCHPMCPNAPEPPKVYDCDSISCMGNGEILAGENVTMIEQADGSMKYYCADCITSNTTEAEPEEYEPPYDDLDD
jgi:hypothetical protein